jgi:general L-amino acid transport system permease protein
VLPLLLPPGLAIPQLIRALFMITIFSSAYVAEIVRGGLQGVPTGQYEAARALGLSASRMMALVVLPQALRATIPSMIGHVISVFKDTSLLAALDIFSELLDTAERATNDLRFVGHQAEALLPAAFLFWLIAFSLSRWSQRLEGRLGVGER